MWGPQGVYNIVKIIAPNHIRQMSLTLSLRPTRAIFHHTSAADLHRPYPPTPPSQHTLLVKLFNTRPTLLNYSSRRWSSFLAAGSRPDDSSASFEMTIDNALKLLGVSQSDSFDDILKAKNSILASCKDDSFTVAQVEAAYDMLLMHSFSQRRAGKVVNSSIRYADVKPVAATQLESAPNWLQTSLRNPPLSVESPSTTDLGIQAGLYGALMVLTYANGASTSSAYGGPDVPGLILASSFGASLYFMTKNNVKLGKATLITIGGLAAGAAVGSAVENWLQVDIVPFFGIHSPPTVVSEFIIFSQFLVTLFLR